VWQANSVGHAQQFRPCPIQVAAVADVGEVVLIFGPRPDQAIQPVDLYLIFSLFQT